MCRPVGSAMVPPRGGKSLAAVLDAGQSRARGAVTPEGFVWVLGSLCRVNRRPFDARLLLQRFPAPHSLPQFLEAAQSLGFKTGETALSAKAIAGLRQPAVSFLKGEPPNPAILVKADG